MQKAKCKMYDMIRGRIRQGRLTVYSEMNIENKKKLGPVGRKGKPNLKAKVPISFL